MAGPMSGVTISASQIAQQKVQDQAGQQAAKNGPSKFDAAMANKAQGPQAAQAVGQVGQVQATQRVDVARAIEQIQKSQKAQMSKVKPQALTEKAAPPVEGPGKATQSVMKMLSHLEKGQGVMDKLIAAGASGKNMSNGELIALQAGVYKYTQELDLTSKIVEQATSGLKDTLKTQV